VNEGGKRGEERTFLIWNVAGLRKKEEEFWEYVCKYDFICLEKT